MRKSGFQDPAHRFEVIERLNESKLEERISHLQRNPSPDFKRSSGKLEWWEEEKAIGSISGPQAVPEPSEDVLPGNELIQRVADMIDQEIFDLIRNEQGSNYQSEAIERLDENEFKLTIFPMKIKERRD